MYLNKEVQRFYEGPMSDGIKRKSSESDEEFMFRVRQAAEDRRRDELNTKRRRTSPNLNAWDNNRRNDKW